MNVAIVCGSLGITGGTNKQVLRLCQSLSKQSIPFTIYTPEYNNEKTYDEFNSFNDHIKVFSELVSTNSSLPSFIKKIIFYYKLTKIIQVGNEIINLHDAYLNWMCPFFFIHALFSKPSKIIWQINDFIPQYNVGPFANREESSFFSKDTVIRYFDKFSTLFLHVITVNVKKNEVLAKHFYHKKNTFTFYPGIDFTDIIVKNKELKNNKLKLLSVGVLYSQRRYEDCINCIKILKEKYQIEVTLDIVGNYVQNMNYYNELMQLAQSLGVKDNIFFLGQISSSQIHQLHLNADIFLFYNHNQSWGLSVFEAMQYQIPVVTSTTVGAAEILTNDVNAVIIEPLQPDLLAKAIIRLMNDTNYYNTITKNALLLCKNYTWDATYCHNMIQLMKSRS